MVSPAVFVLEHEVKERDDSKMFIDHNLNYKMFTKERILKLFTENVCAANENDLYEPEFVFFGGS